MTYTIEPVGIIHSPIKDRAEAPKQETEAGAPQAVVEIFEPYQEAMKELKPGQEVILLTWFHMSDREVLTCHPRGDTSRPRRGVFDTRSPDRPNPVGIHQVTIKSIDKGMITVHPLEAIDGTPVVDIKCMRDKRES